MELGRRTGSEGNHPKIPGGTLDSETDPLLAESISPDPAWSEFRASEFSHRLASKKFMRQS